MKLTSYNLSRSILAFSLILTLVFNTNYTLFGLDIIHLENPIFEFNFFYIFRENLILAKCISILVLLIVVSGFYPRYTGLLHWYITYSFFMSADVADGGDHIASNLTLLLIPLTLFDSRKSHWQLKNIESNKYKKYFINSIYFLIAIQVCTIYLHAFVGKVFVEEWKNGTAVYYWFTHNHFGVSPIFKDLTIQILSNKYIVLIISWFTLVLEFLLASCIILSKKDKRRFIFLFFGILFHLSIMLIHGLVSFFYIMTSALILYLVPNNYEISIKKIKNKLTWKQFINQFLH